METPITAWAAVMAGVGTLIRRRNRERADQPGEQARRTAPARAARGGVNRIAAPVAASGRRHTRRHLPRLARTAAPVVRRPAHCLAPPGRTTRHDAAPLQCRVYPVPMPVPEESR